jgi:hypothetical protein
MRCSSSCQHHTDAVRLLQVINTRRCPASARRAHRPPPAQVCALLERSVPTAVGLLAIPFIVHPIDRGVHALLDATLRPTMQRAICTSGGGKEAGLDMCEAAYASDESTGEPATGAPAYILQTGCESTIAC